MEKTELEKKMESEMGEGRPVAAPLVTEMKTKAVVPFAGKTGRVWETGEERLLILSATGVVMATDGVRKKIVPFGNIEWFEVMD